MLKMIFLSPLIYLGLLIFWMNITWVFFSAVMRWRELHDQGKLDSKHLIVRWAIYINLAVGFLLDAALNILVSPVMLELPRYDLKFGDAWWAREVLLTDRLIRWHHTTNTSWWTIHVRARMVRLGQSLLDIVDTDGTHIK